MTQTHVQNLKIAVLMGALVIGLMAEDAADDLSACGACQIEAAPTLVGGEAEAGLPPLTDI